MEDDEFFLNDDELANDNQLSIVDMAKDKLLDAIAKACSEAKLNLKYNERKDASSQISLISNYTTLLIQLNNIDEENTSIAQQQELIDEILKQTTELTLSNIDDVLPEEDEENNGNEDSDEDEGADDSGLDF